MPPSFRSSDCSFRMKDEIRFLLYNTPETKGNIQVYVKDDTLWATQKAIAELFDVHASSVSRHLSNIYEEKELDESSTIANFAIVVKRGFRGEVKEDMLFYNLDAIAGKTAAEIVWQGADHNKEHMGLRTWKHAPDGRIMKSDVVVAKNYLEENS